jgi:hypothetical protein
MQCACSDSDGVFNYSKSGLAVSSRRPKIEYTQMFLASATGSTYNARITWQMIVEDYSDLALSFESDRLPALAGPAKQLRKVRPGDWYLAGVWKNTFFEDVLWKASSQAYQYSRPRDSPAPTWSWASVKGRVSYFAPPSGTCSRLGFLPSETP